MEENDKVRVGEEMAEVVEKHPKSAKIEKYKALNNLGKIMAISKVVWRTIIFGQFYNLPIAS